MKDKSVRKRLALLINNIDFKEKSMTRRGADRDEENMEWLLKELDYQVVKYRNLSAKVCKSGLMKLVEKSIQMMHIQFYIENLYSLCI